MKLPELKIDNLIAKIPIIQGGMSIRISTGELAGAVAATGAIGVIGASGMDHVELIREIKIARGLAKGGIVGINILFAAKDFIGIVQTAIKEKIDFITSGAGFSRDLFKLGKASKTPILPIVSSGKLAKIAESLGASAIVAESCEAGGHLGTLEIGTEDLLKEVKESVKSVPVIAAGGIADGQGIAKILNMGADGVQMATRFILAEECAAAKAYKELHQKTVDPSDVIIIKSPVGLPGRAIKTRFTEKLYEGDYPGIDMCDNCLKNCSAVYCIFDALKRAQQGDIDNGLVFTGASVTKIKDKRIRPVKDIINDLVKEAEEYYHG